MLDKGRGTGKKVKPGTDRAQLIKQIEKATISMAEALDEVSIPENIFAYNPLIYARKAYFSYVERFARSPIEGLFLGMNPGPNGMMQTGIPFGDIPSVRNFLKIDSGVTKPRREHAKRPIQGFDWPKREVSGTRLWDLFSNTFENAESFFENYFVFNYCPLAFLSESGANLTPDKLPLATRREIEKICDEHLKEIVVLLSPQKLIGIGGYASKILSRLFPDSAVLTLLHPSPASPAANKGWARIAKGQLKSGKLRGFVPSKS